MTGHHSPHHKTWILTLTCLLCFSAVAGGRPWLFPPALAGPFGHSTHLSVATMGTPWLCSCFPTGMLSPQTGARLAPVPSPMTITLAGSAVRGCAATAHHSLLFSLDNQFPGCRLQAVAAFLQHPTPQGLATWAWCALLPEWRFFCPVSSDYTGHKLMWC